MNSSYSFSLISKREIDNNTFAWPLHEETLPTPPVAAEIRGNLYRLSNFSSQTSEFLSLKIDNFYEALNLSINLCGNRPSIPELGMIYKICLNFNLNHDKISAFKSAGIKGGKSFEILKLLPSLPQNLLNYLEEKNIPIKIIGLLCGFNSTQLGFITDFAVKKDPTLQNFKKFVENAADFKSLITSAVYKEDWSVPETKSPQRKEVENSLKDLQQKAFPNKIFSPDNFETGRIAVSMEISSVEEYDKMIQNLIDSKKEIKILFDLLTHYDIR